MKPSVAHAYGKRADGTGEHWWFVARRRIFERILREWLPWPRQPWTEQPSPRQPRLLDLGPGYGVHSALLADFGRVLAVDLDPASLEACRDLAPCDLLVADASAPPIRDESCDLVLALDILEHLDDDESALRECLRVLRPGGRLLATVAALPLLWGRQDVQSEHRRRYRRRELRDRVRAAGFEIERLSYFNFFLFPLIFAVRLLMRPFLSRWKSGRSDLDLPAPFGANRILAAIFAAEAGILVRRDLPIGVSLICLARRPGPGQAQG